MFIQNVSRAAAKTGEHISPGRNSMLISITDPCQEYLTPAFPFKEIHRFEFLDTDDESNEFSCTSLQATELVLLLEYALDNEMNVIVHCNAGIYRSGAVAEIGVIMGFRDTHTHRIPNVLIKNLMMRKLYEIGDRSNSSIVP